MISLITSSTMDPCITAFNQIKKITKVSAFKKTIFFNSFNVISDLSSKIKSHFGLSRTQW